MNIFLSGDRYLLVWKIHLRVALLGGIVLGLAIAGCSQPVKLQPGEPVLLDVPAEELWRICKSELKNRGFVLDYVDQRSGRIVTDPLVSRQWFEFWCQDVVTIEGILEASLHTIRRIIYLEIQPVERGRFSLRCMARVERMSMERDIVSGRVRMQVFGAAGRMPLLAGPTSSPGPEPQWLPLGHDTDLEIDILRSIQQSVAKNKS